MTYEHGTHFMFPQPTLSRQLSQMEEELGVKLFHRGARKIILTNEGLLLRRRAEEILSLVDKTEQEEQVEGLRVALGQRIDENIRR